MRADAQRNRERILEAAETVFAERGASASTEDVAELAGVAIGTVFRHFPTKKDLLQAIMKNLMARLTARAAAETDLFEFFDCFVAEAASKKTVVGLLADAGLAVEVADSVQQFREAVVGLLDAARKAGAVRAEVQVDEVLALLTATSQGALRAGWDADLRRRTLAIIYAGLRPA
ncbi:TetR/AcrR family transcriptional regulator [Amycolatopsis sp. cmx-4-68]|uniref:TetR/AcrR family transcriptional regulator n=1 Tax=Amycolatopsis sp. cmx-4-68 TaxID=2790938 RepID=UPI00397B51D0